MMDYNQLAALAAVIEEGGFERAGELLCISQSAVTQRIRQLEESSGRILLDRGRPPRPTAEGLRLLEHFRKVEILEKELNREQGAAPRIPLAVNADSLATWLSPVLASYMRRDRGRVEIRVADQEQTRELLSRGEVMGCISASPAPVRACRVLPLGAMSYRLAASRSFAERYLPAALDPGTPPDPETLAKTLARAPRLEFNRDDGLLNALYRDILSDASEEAIPGDSLSGESHFVPSSELFPLLLARGELCGMIPEVQFEEYSESLDLVDLCPVHPVRVPLYWQRWSIASGELEALSRLITEEAARSLETISP